MRMEENGTGRGEDGGRTRKKERRKKGENETGRRKNEEKMVRLIEINRIVNAGSVSSRTNRTFGSIKNRTFSSRTELSEKG